MRSRDKWRSLTSDCADCIWPFRPLMADASSGLRVLPSAIHRAVVLLMPAAAVRSCTSDCSCRHVPSCSMQAELALATWAGGRAKAGSNAWPLTYGQKCMGRRQDNNR